MKTSVEVSEGRCVVCRKIIRGKPRIMTLQITSEDPKFAERARKLGFSSASWHAGDSIHAPFHKECFDMATIVWQVAFGTRAVSPRRQ